MSLNNMSEECGQSTENLRTRTGLQSEKFSMEKGKIKREHLAGMLSFHFKKGRSPVSRRWKGISVFLYPMKISYADFVNK